MNYNLEKIYKTNSKNEIIIVFNLDCKEYKLCVNEENIKYLSKSLNHDSINSAILYWKQKEVYNKNSNKKEINEKKMKTLLKIFDIEYNFIGKYLLNIKFGNKNYVVDFFNNTIESFTILETYNNEEDTETESSVNVVKKNIEKINLFDSNNLSDELKKLLNFTVNNTEILKPVLSILNSKTDNMVENIIKSSGFDIDLKENVNLDKIIKIISNHLKIIEELNNSNISEIKENEETKFNFLLTEISNQLNSIITQLNKMSPNDENKVMCDSYHKKIDDLKFSQNSIQDKKIQNLIIEKIINSISNLIFENFFKLVESKYLELNLLLQNYNNSPNNLLNDKINDMLSFLFSLHKKYFSDLFDKSEVNNIFSKFHKLTKFSNIFNSLDKEAKGYLVSKMSEYKETKDISFELIENKIKLLFEDMLLENFNSNEIISFMDYPNILSKDLEEMYKIYYKILKIIYPNETIFKETLKELYNKEILINKKSQLSKLLLNFHEEIKFKISVITKVLNR